MTLLTTLSRCASSFTLTIIGTDIGEGSCNEFGACYKTSGKSETVECSMTLCVKALTINACFHIQTGAEFEDQSCNGEGACGLSPGIVVEEGSCNKSYEDDYAMCGLASGAHIGKESCLGYYGEVMLKISIVALINSLCVNISIIYRFINHHLKLAPIGMVSVQLKAVVDVMGYAFVHDLILSPFTLTSLSGSEIGKGSCQGRASCSALLYLDEDEDGRYSDGPGGNIGDGSCNNVRACNSFRGIVGNDSCNSNLACANGKGTVHDGSCGRSDSDHKWACFAMASESRERQETSDIILYFLTILSSFTHLLRHCA